MKAKFFLLGLCALALAACSIDEVSQVNDTNAIQFKATTATRVAATTTNSIQEFTVWAWNDSNLFMDHVTASKQSNGLFTTSPYYFWPTGSVDFYALAPASVGYGVDPNTNDELAYIGGEISIDEDVDGNGHLVYTGNVATADIQEDNIVIDVYVPGKAAEQIDLIYAIAKDRTSGSVPMNFRHALSQVTFKAKDVNEDFVVDIAGVSVCSVYKHGTYTLNKVASTTDWLDSDNIGTGGIASSQGTWGTNEEYKARFEAGITAQTLATDGTVVDITSDPLMLLPQTVEAWDPEVDYTDSALGSYIAILCHVTEHGSTLWPNENETEDRIETIGGTDYAYIAVPVDVAWEEGYRYTYTIIFGDGLGYYPPDDDNFDLEGTPVLVPISFKVTVDEFQDAGNTDVKTDTDLSYIEVKNQAELEGAIHSGYQEICVADDIELTTYLEFTQDCILDIADGVTLTAPNSTSKDDDAYIMGTTNCYSAAIYVTGGTLTINGPGTVATTGGSESAYTEGIWVAGGTVIINSGTFKGGSWSADPDSVTGSESAVYVDPGAAYIYGGTFTSGNFRDGEHWAINCGNSSYKAGEAMIYCYGGTYTDGFNPADPQTDDAPSYVAEGYGVTYDESNNSYTVVYTTVATPADLAAALAAGASEITVSESFSIKQGGGDHENHHFDITSKCTITLEDGVVLSLDSMETVDNYTFFWLGEGADLTIEGNGTLMSQGADGDKGAMCFWINGGNLTINGGTYYSGAWAEEEVDDSGHCVYVYAGSATINAGTFVGTQKIYKTDSSGTKTGYYATNFLLNCRDANYKDGSANIYVSGGTYCNFDPHDNAAEGSGTNFCVEGYTTTSEEGTLALSDGSTMDVTWYTVVEDK